MPMTREKRRFRQVRTAIKASLARLEAEIAALIEAAPELRRKAGLKRSVKGISPATVAAILAYLPDLGSLSKAQAPASPA